MASNKEIMEQWFQRVWTEEDPSAIDDLLVPDGNVTGLGEKKIVGPDDFKTFQAALCSILSDISVSIDRCIDDGEWSALYCTLRAKSRATGKPVAMTGSALIRVEDNVIREGHNYFDFMGLWSQLGYLPTDSFEQGLRGEKIA